MRIAYSQSLCGHKSKINADLVASESGAQNFESLGRSRVKDDLGGDSSH